LLTRLVRQHIAPLLRANSPVAINAAGTATPCNVAGDFTLDSGPTSAKLTFRDCSDVAGQSLNGAVTIVGLEQTPSGFTGTASVGVALRRTGIPDFLVAGSNIAVSDSFDGITDTVTLAGLEITTATGSIFEQLANYSFVSMFDSGAGIETDAITLDYASTKIGGQVHVDTDTSPVTNSASDFPRSGALLITGTGGSSARLTANGDESLLDSPQVTIQVDVDGDGNFESTLNQNWSDLDTGN